MAMLLMLDQEPLVTLHEYSEPSPVDIPETMYQVPTSS